MDGICVETWVRIRVSIYALAYEYYNVSLVSDEKYDFLASTVNLTNTTKRPDLDEWFINNYSPDTSIWVWNRPEINQLHYILKHEFNLKDIKHEYS